MRPHGSNATLTFISTPTIQSVHRLRLLRREPPMMDSVHTYHHQQQQQQQHRHRQVAQLASAGASKDVYGSARMSSSRHCVFGYTGRPIPQPLAVSKVCPLAVWTGPLCGLTPAWPRLRGTAALSKEPSRYRGDLRMHLRTASRRHRCGESTPSAATRPRRHYRRTSTWKEAPGCSSTLR